MQNYVFSYTGKDESCDFQFNYQLCHLQSDYVSKVGVTAVAVAAVVVIVVVVLIWIKDISVLYVIIHISLDKFNNG